MYVKTPELIFINAALLSVLGLWFFFSGSLPSLDSSMFSVFPKIYPIIISALLLFIYPLTKEKGMIWPQISALLSIMVSLTATAQLFAEFRISLLILLAVNLFFNLIICFQLLKPNRNSV